MTLPEIRRIRSISTRPRACSANQASVVRNWRRSYSAAAPDYQNVLQIWQQDLAKIGVTLTLKSTEPVAYVDQLFNAKFGALIGGNSLFGQLHPAFFWGNAYYSPAMNWANFKSDEYASDRRRSTEGNRSSQAEAGLWSMDQLHPGPDVGAAVVQHGAACRGDRQSARTHVQHDRVPHAQ